MRVQRDSMELECRGTVWNECRGTVWNESEEGQYGTRVQSDSME